MARTLTLFALSRLGAYLDGFKIGTRAADYTPLASLIEETVKWLS